MMANTTLFFLDDYYLMKLFNYSDELCKENINYSFNIAESIISSICILLGIIYSILGYRYLRSTFFFTGFLFCSLFIYVLCQYSNSLSFKFLILSAASAGVLGGFVCSLLFSIGFFVTGFFAGFMLMLIGLMIVQQFVVISSPWIAGGLLIAGGTIIAGLNIKFTRNLSIIGTSILGVSLLTFGVDNFASSNLLLKHCYARMTTGPSLGYCWITILLIVASFLYLICSLCIQACGTAKGIYHKERYVPCCTALRQVFCCDYSYEGRSRRSNRRSYHPTNCQPTSPETPSVQLTGASRCTDDETMHTTSSQHPLLASNNDSFSQTPLLPSVDNYSQHPLMLGCNNHHVGGLDWKSTLSSSASSQYLTPVTGSLRPPRQEFRNDRGVAGKKRKPNQGSDEKSVQQMDKFCRLYRLRQRQGDVPSESAMKAFQLRQSQLLDEEYDA